MGRALQDDGGGHGRYDQTAGAAPQEPTLAADAPSFISGISGIINCIPQLDGEDDDDESEDVIRGRLLTPVPWDESEDESQAAGVGHSPPPPLLRSQASETLGDRSP